MGAAGSGFDRTGVFADARRRCDTLLDLPCPSFLIEHPKGLVLFDTGCNPKVIDDAVGYWGQVAEHLPLKWNKQDTLDKQIRGRRL